MAPLPPTGGAPPAGPKMPGSPTGGPPGPGSTPILAPGGGAGNAAAAVTSIKAAMPTLYKGLAAFPPGSKENQAILRALSALAPIFGKPEGDAQVPAAIQNMVMNAKQQTGPVGAAPPPGLATSPMPPGGEPPPPPL